MAEVIIQVVWLVIALAALGRLKEIAGHLRAIALSHGHVAGEIRQMNIRDAQRPWQIGGRR